MKRIAWSAMGAVLLAALAGLFGPGPLSTTTVAGDGYSLRHERFERRMRPSRLQFDIERPSASGTVAVWLDRGYVDRVLIDQVTPEPERVAALPDRVVFHFRMQPPASASFALRPDTTGVLNGRVGLEDGLPLPFSQFVYP